MDSRKDGDNGGWSERLMASGCKPEFPKGDAEVQILHHRPSSAPLKKQADEVPMQ